MLKVKPLNQNDYQQLSGLLQAAGLCHTDLKAPEVELFGVSAAGGWVGYFGYEIYGHAALFRSLVVVPGFRGQGYGTLIWQEAKERLQNKQAKEVYLLTNTAAPFFARLGFAAVPRASVPVSIAATTEFKEFCPADSVCMKLVL